MHEDGSSHIRDITFVAHAVAIHLYPVLETIERNKLANARKRFHRAIYLDGSDGFGQDGRRRRAGRGGSALEVLVLDSTTLYRRMDIGTGKPLLRICRVAESRTTLIDLIEPWESASVATYREWCCEPRFGTWRAGAEKSCSWGARRSISRRWRAGCSGAREPMLRCGCAWRTMRRANTGMDMLHCRLAVPGIHRPRFASIRTIVRAE